MSLVNVVVRKSGLAVVTLARPKALNGLSLAMFKAVVGAAQSLATDPAVRGVVLRGEGRGFCAGLDVPSMAKQGPGVLRTLLDREAVRVDNTREAVRVDNLAQAVGYQWRCLPVPVVCALHGVCFGGGLQIALGADVRFSTADCRFSVMEAKWGLIPDMSASVTLRECVPITTAKRLSWTAEILDGNCARDVGLVTEVCEPVGSLLVALPHLIL